MSDSERALTQVAFRLPRHTVDQLKHAALLAGVSQRTALKEAIRDFAERQHRELADRQHREFADRQHREFADRQHRDFADRQHRDFAERQHRPARRAR